MTVLPDGWADATIGEVTQPFAVRDPGTDPRAVFRYIDISSIDNAEQKIAAPKELLGRDAPSRARRLVKSGDVLFSTVRTYLKNIAMVPPDLDGAVTSTGVAVLRPADAVDGRYLFHWVCSAPFIEAMSKAQDGTMYPAVTDRDVAAGMIALPPLAEQRRIAAKLDALTARTASARAELDRVPALSARYKRAVLVAAFRGELSTKGSGDGVAAAWRELRVEQVAEVITGSTPPSAERGTRGEVPFFKPTDLDAGYNVSIPRETLTPEGARRSRMVSAGATLVTCIGATIGKTGFTRVACCTNQQINALVPKEQFVRPKWLYWNAISPSFQQQIKDNSSATTLPIINKGRFRKLMVPVAPLVEQDEIILKLEAAFAEIDRLAAEAAAARRLMDRLDEAILAKAFRGELVPQDPADEPATVLLERIRAERTVVSSTRRGRPAEVVRAVGTATGSSTGSARSAIVPRTSGDRPMTKSRLDDDVWHKPYLAGVIGKGAPMSAQALFKLADLPVPDFYKQLAWEISQHLVRESGEALEAG